jgi:ribosomal protein S18 acetylase RimI-like enzyme
MERGPVVLADKLGKAFEACRCGRDDLSPLMDMYAIFAPRPASLGLPPADDAVCTGWVRGLLEIGENVVATRDRRVIGHAALIPDRRGDSSEFLIFVHQDFRNVGIGTQLSRATLKRAESLASKSVWLTVAVTNFVAIRLYRKLGFEYIDLDDYERTMVFRFPSPEPKKL